ncbi:class I SAM-dependent methyltransferase [Sphingomonas sp. BIUV-7]|uniref:Class I SAM-dependent methyltransferase n=1 Tax=Sphingomonas natans TaxID=3063330 RepID=A0ABT8Y8U3_9SPHN|nr:class I SAM-dependent methyltransferase [Sphingomonas sp. BIUV-7]MDO6414746.1 class I SAM-dependent methyltransferase [Sphingomonas sp. BIUV-7]
MKLAILTSFLHARSFISSGSISAFAPTGLLAVRDPRPDRPRGGSISAFAYRMLFGAIGWPWLLRSLHGGSRAARERLAARLGWPLDALPRMGSWKADAGFLHRIVDAVETLRPATVVELGAGASTLVCARALALHGGGRLISYDQHAPFVAAVRTWLCERGLAADVRHAPLTRTIPGWPGDWYEADGLPETIDLLLIDGPPWAIHPFVRGGAESLFDRIAPGGRILLDDAARPGERIVARRWRRAWPDMRFRLAGGGSKGTLIGEKPAIARPDPPPETAGAELIGVTGD